SLCGACRDVCPVRLDIPRMLLALRQQAVERTPQPFTLRTGLRAFAYLATRPQLYRRAMAWTRTILRSRASGGWIKRAPGLAARWTEFRDLRAPAAQTFESQWRTRATGRKQA